ncbi:RHS repeat-associated core domain-containing protein [Planctomicrobium sp. SH661]|uniref:RHS repeat-associated core domain-containing protein n=1 Tax=Planctomicrobium sp. SH661 TaxID=3448124 RepID=UPI003F5C0761
MTDESATKTDEYAYEAFGKELFHTGTTENKFTYVGELGYYRDADGHYLLRRRPLTSEIARFDAEDPLSFDSGDEDLYRYVNNNPTNAVDPSGEGPQWHHLLPQARESIFIEAGFKPLEIHEPQWGWMMDEDDHRKLHGPWNSDWNSWYLARKQKGLPITRRAVQGQLRASGQNLFSDEISPGDE